MSAPTLVLEPVPSTAERPVQTLADLLARLGDIPLERVWFLPHPGPATEEDVFARPDGEKHLFELVDGVLVEKPMGYYESRLALVLGRYLEQYMDENDRGIILGEQATLRLAPGNVRLPDVSFLSWEHFPDRLLPAEQIADMAPDLAVEVLSPGNTAAEMDRKLREYFAAGTKLAWYVYTETRTVRVYTSPESFITLTEADSLTGEPLLPGFRLSIHDWFERAGRRAPKAE